MQIIVDDFNRTVGREKKIFVNCLTISEIEQRTLVATAAGVPPDVAGVTDEQIVPFAAQDALEPLDELAAAHGIARDTYKPVCWDGCVYEGHLWALPSTPASVALHYNKRVLHENARALRDAGFDPDHIPTTLAEFDRFARVLDRKDAAGKIIRSGYLPDGAGLVHQFHALLVWRQPVRRTLGPVHADRSPRRADVRMDSRLLAATRARGRSTNSRAA